MIRFRSAPVPFTGFVHALRPLGRPPPQLFAGQTQKKFRRPQILVQGAVRTGFRRHKFQAWGPQASGMAPQVRGKGPVGFGHGATGLGRGSRDVWEWRHREGGMPPLSLGHGTCGFLGMGRRRLGRWPLGDGGPACAARGFGLLKRATRASSCPEAPRAFRYQAAGTEVLHHRRWLNRTLEFGEVGPGAGRGGSASWGRCRGATSVVAGAWGVFGG